MQFNKKLSGVLRARSSDNDAGKGEGWCEVAICHFAFFFAQIKLRNCRNKNPFNVRGEGVRF